MSEIDRFQTSLIRLDDALTSAGFAYALIGGIAVNLRGLSRGTLDIDAVVCRADARLPELLAALEGAGFGPRGERGFSASLERRVTLAVDASGTELDLALGLLPFEEEAVERAEQLQISTGTVRVLTVEDLVIMKLVAGRPRDLADVAQLVEIHPHLDRERIRTLVQVFAEFTDSSEMLARLEQLL